MQKQFNLITFAGPEAAGKTTLSNLVSSKIGGVPLIVPEWPYLQKFLDSPTSPEIAYRNQMQAMEYTMKHVREISVHSRNDNIMITADICPERIHYIHSRKLYLDGLISDKEWKLLEIQYEKNSHSWGKTYVYLNIDIKILERRLMLRKRKEDLIYNLNQLEAHALLWEKLFSNKKWIRDKKILEINEELSPDEMSDLVIKWLRK